MWSGAGTLPHGYGAAVPTAELHPSEEPRLTFLTVPAPVAVRAGSRPAGVNTAMTTGYGPSWVALGPPQSPGYGFAGYGAAVSSRCAAMLAQRRAALKEMARSPLLSARRRAAEKEANKWGKAYNACKKAERKAAKSSGATLAPVAAEPPDVPEVTEANIATLEPSAALPVAAPAPVGGLSRNTMIVGGVVGVAALIGIALYLRKGKAK